MKKLFITSLLSLASITIFGQSITLTPNNSGVNTEGRMYYDNVTKEFRYWNGSVYAPVGGSGGSGGSWALSGLNLYSTNAGNVGVGTDTPNSKLTIRHNFSNLLSLQNTSALGSGVTNSISFGGTNYTTGVISTIGTSTSAARMGFLTGYSFTGGISSLQERLSIANNGNVGVGQTNPQSTLDVGGSIRFSGSNPAAFVLTATIGVNSYTYFSTGAVPTLITSPAPIYSLRIDHPMCNNNPKAIIMVTPQERYFAGVIYTGGYWYLVPDAEYKLSFTRVGVKLSCAPTAVCIDALAISDRENKYFWDGLKFNILIIQN